VEHLLVCNKCQQVLVKSIDGVTKVVNKILLFKGDQGYAVCKGCNREVLVPIKLDRGELLLKSKNPKLILNR
jgi:ribosomal protein S27E